MSAEMFSEVTNVTAESEPGKKRRRITRGKIGLDDHLCLSPKREQPKKTTSEEFRTEEQCDTLTRTLLLSMSNVPHALILGSIRLVFVDLHVRNTALIGVV
jgi:methylase of polypeptide subunit release factors